MNLSSTANYYTAVGQGGSVMSTFYLQYSLSQGTWAFVRPAGDSSSAAQFSAHASAAPALNTWTHLVGVYDSSNGAMTLYVNGQPAGTAIDTSPWNATGPTSACGVRQVGGGDNNYFNGSISNVQVYQRALSGTDVSTLFTGGRTGGTVASSTQLTTSRTLDQRGLPTSLTDPNGNVTNYTHDEAGNLAMTVRPTVSSELGGGIPMQVHPTTYTGYNTFGEAAETDDENGNVTTNGYDADGHLVSVSDPVLNLAGGGTGVGVTVNTYDKLGQLTKVSDQDGDTTQYVYDQLGDVVRETDAMGGNTDSTYDTNGDKLSETDPTGAQTQATYDFMGRQLTSTKLERHPSPVSATTTNSYAASASNPGGAFLASTTTPAGVVTRYGYDTLGERTSVTDGAGNTSHTGFNFLGDPQVTTLPDGTTTTVSYDATENPVRKVQADANGNQLAVTSAG